MIELATATYWSVIHFQVSDPLAGSAMHPLSGHLYLFFTSPTGYGSSLAAEAAEFLFLVILLAGK